MRTLVPMMMVRSHSFLSPFRLRPSSCVLLLFPFFSFSPPYSHKTHRVAADQAEDVVEGDSAVIAGGDDEDDDDEEK